MRLYSERYGLVRSPDRIERRDGYVIPEEWKTSKRVSHGHRLQLGTYFIRIEETYGEVPPYVVVVLGDGSRVRIENTEDHRSEALEIADAI